MVKTVNPNLKSEVMEILKGVEQIPVCRVYKVTSDLEKQLMDVDGINIIRTSDKMFMILNTKVVYVKVKGYTCSDCKKLFEASDSDEEYWINVEFETYGKVKCDDCMSNTVNKCFGEDAVKELRGE